MTTQKKFTNLRNLNKKKPPKKRGGKRADHEGSIYYWEAKKLWVASIRLGINPKTGKEYTSGAKHLKHKGLNKMYDEWKALYDEWKLMPNASESEKEAKAAKTLEVQQAWNLYRNAQGNLVDILLEMENGERLSGLEADAYELTKGLVF
jgi:hypothetical protein